MFVSVSKNLFSKEPKGNQIVDEINTSLRMFEEKLNNKEVPSINKRIKVEKVEFEGEAPSISYSVLIGNQVVLFFKTEGKDYYKLPIKYAPRTVMMSKTFHELNWYGTVTVNTGGEIRLSEEATKTGTWVYTTWIVSNSK